MKTLDGATGISDRDRQMLRDLKDVIRQVLETADVWLYGSVARGTQGPESDYDVLVLTDRPLSYAEQDAVGDLVFDWELDRDVVISLMFRSKEEWGSPLAKVSPFHREVERDALAI